VKQPNWISFSAGVLVLVYQALYFEHRLPTIAPRFDLPPRLHDGASFMSVFFSSGPTPDDRDLAELWHLLENEYFEEAMTLAEAVCQNPDAPIEFYCGLSLAYGELGYYPDAERIARKAINFGESHWRARHALAVALMHQGRFLGALDILGFYRSPDELYLARVQIEKMGSYIDSLQVTLEDALQKDVPPAIYLYLAYLYGALEDDVPDWDGQTEGWTEVIRYGKYLSVWEHDAARHARTPYGDHLAKHVSAIQRILESDN
jgi:tetratricopeptide (TPR) repeat protein